VYKTTIVAALTAALIPSLAGAADMPVKALPLAVAPAPTWTGPYVGADVGGSWFDPRFSTDVPSIPIVNKKPPPPCMKWCYSPDPLFGFGSSDGAIVGGVHAGYDYQFLPTWVVGVEGDFDGTSAKATGTVSTLTLPGSFASSSESIDWLASLRARLGYLVTPTIMLYGTGGLAWADVNYSATAQITSSAVANSSFDSIRSGWVAGAGAEWLIMPHLTIRGEYLYYDINSGASASAAASPLVTPTPISFAWSKVAIQVARVGASWRF
jgi:outer membrane immunogenic protein